jgi:hypothetical protein
MCVSKIEQPVSVGQVEEPRADSFEADLPLSEQEILADGTASLGFGVERC